MSPSASDSASPSPQGPRPIRRVGILFAGGPAPAANAVISTAAASFLRHDIEVLGILHGYAHLVEYGDDHPMEEGRDYIVLDQIEAQADAQHPRHLDRHLAHQPRQGRVEPGHLTDPERTAAAPDGAPGPRLAGRRRPGLDRRRRHAQDGQQVQAVPGVPARRASSGSRWSTSPRRSTTTTAASTSRSATSRPSRPWPSEIRNLLADAEAGRMYFLVETMGRSAGWLAYGAAIAGEASLVISVEDLDERPR